MKTFISTVLLQRICKAIKLATSITLLLFGFASKSLAQHILFVNDNNNILYNTDTIRSDMNYTIYSGYHYWSVPDSAFVAPTAAYMATFDLVVWYCSTDGVGLSFWNSTTSANPAIVSYASSGKPIWIIGQDILYQMYAEGSLFASGDFAKKYMGLISYDVQSYIDDGGTGLPEADRTATASPLFPSTLKWIFSTLWYADGCTVDTGTKEIYEMGPSSYTLYGRKCMFHNLRDGYSVMSTFFDPALIDSFSNRVRFLENGITYLLGSTELKSTGKSNFITFYPNPVTTYCTFEIISTKIDEVTIEFFDVLGNKVLQQEEQLSTGQNLINVSVAKLFAGVYLVQIKEAEGKTIFRRKLVKQ